MSDFLFSFAILLIALAIPMIHSLTFFISERRGNSRIKNYLKYIILFPIYYLLFFISYALFFELIHIIDYIINKIFNYKLIDLPNIYYSIIVFIIVPILYIILYIKIMKNILVLMI